VKIGYVNPNTGSLTPFIARKPTPEKEQRAADAPPIETRSLDGEAGRDG